MTSPVFADELVVEFHGAKEPTCYERVRYRLWPDGITVWDEDGAEHRHDDVRQATGSKRHDR